jgi:hypothetical protein
VERQLLLPMLSLRQGQCLRMVKINVPCPCCIKHCFIDLMWGGGGVNPHPLKVPKCDILSLRFLHSVNPSGYRSLRDEAKNVFFDHFRPDFNGFF